MGLFSHEHASAEDVGSEDEDDTLDAALAAALMTTQGVSSVSSYFETWTSAGCGRCGTRGSSRGFPTLYLGAQIIGTPVHLSSVPPPPPGPPPPLHEESAAEKEARCTSAVFRAFDFMDGLDSLRATPTPSSRPAPAETQQKKSIGPRPPPVAAKPYLSRPVPRESLPNAESRRFGARFLAAVVCRMPHAPHPGLSYTRSFPSCSAKAQATFGSVTKVALRML